MGDPAFCHCLAGGASDLAVFVLFGAVVLAVLGGQDAMKLEDVPAVMKGLDLVVSCDTAIAHLAGALGVPAWVALKSAPCWRWMSDRDDSPWYPSLRLFRQWGEEEGSGFRVQER